MAESQRFSSRDLHLHLIPTPTIPHITSFTSNLHRATARFSSLDYTEMVALSSCWELRFPTTLRISDQDTNPAILSINHANLESCLWVTHSWAEFDLAVIILSKWSQSCLDNVEANSSCNTYEVLLIPSHLCLVKWILSRTNANPILAYSWLLQECVIHIEPQQALGSS